MIDMLQVFAEVALPAVARASTLYLQPLIAQVVVAQALERDVGKRADRAVLQRNRAERVHVVSDAVHAQRVARKTQPRDLLAAVTVNNEGLERASFEMRLRARAAPCTSMTADWSLRFLFIRIRLRVRRNKSMPLRLISASPPCSNSTICPMSREVAVANALTLRTAATRVDSTTFPISW